MFGARRTEQQPGAAALPILNSPAKKLHGVAPASAS
jgi:hypothetical protein